MKYLLILTLSTILLSCNQTKNNHKEAQADNNKVQVADTAKQAVTLSAVPETLKLSALPDSIQVLMTNNTADTISTGLHYYIEKFEDNKWIDVSPKGIVFHDLGWQLKPNGNESFAKKLYKDQINYKAGKYRIVKYYLPSNYKATKNSHDVYAEFKIR